jgi:hypothetical protein
MLFSKVFENRRFLNEIIDVNQSFAFSHLGKLL